MLPGFFVLHWLLGSARVEAWAGIGAAGDPAVAPLALLAVVAMQVLWLLVTLWFSRAWERQADLDAVTLSEDPQSFRSMQHDLAVENLSDLAPSRWHYALASHPRQRSAWPSPSRSLSSGGSEVQGPVAGSPIARAHR